MHCVEDIFDYLTSPENYNVNLETGEIEITSEYIVNKKKKTTKTKLVLEPSALGDSDILALYVRQLTESVQDLKNNSVPQIQNEIQSLWEKYEIFEEKGSHIQVKGIYSD